MLFASLLRLPTSLGIRSYDSRNYVIMMRKNSANSNVEMMWLYHEIGAAIKKIPSLFEVYLYIFEDQIGCDVSSNLSCWKERNVNTYNKEIQKIVIRPNTKIQKYKLEYERHYKNLSSSRPQLMKCWNAKSADDR